MAPSLGFTNTQLFTARRIAGVRVPYRGHWAEHQTLPSIETRIAASGICKVDFRDTHA